MKAIIATRYGGPEVLASREIDRPVIGAGEVLVRVRAAGLHIGDVFGVRGSPFLMRFTSGLRRPKLRRARVRHRRNRRGGRERGDPVRARRRGVRHLRLAHGRRLRGVRPGRGRDARAQAGRDDLRGGGGPPDLRVRGPPRAARRGRLQAGQKVLINGASGGVGTYAVQIARALGAEVTGVCGPANADAGPLARRAPRDRLHARGLHDRAAVRYDLILDNLENHSLSACRSVLEPGGTLVLNSGTGASGLKLMIRLIRPVLLSGFVKQNLRRYLSVPKHEDLEVLAKMVGEGTLRPVIGATYPLSEVPAAIRHLEAGHARGKVVVAI